MVKVVERLGFFHLVLGPGFGVISKTAGSSRQIQLSRTVIY
jgi:hypothetical protein